MRPPWWLLVWADIGGLNKQSWAHSQPAPLLGNGIQYGALTWAGGGDSVSLCCTSIPLYGLKRRNHPSSAVLPERGFKWHFHPPAGPRMEMSVEQEVSSKMFPQDMWWSPALLPLEIPLIRYHLTARKHWQLVVNKSYPLISWIQPCSYLLINENTMFPFIRNAWKCAIHKKIQLNLWSISCCDPHLSNKVIFLLWQWHLFRQFLVLIFFLILFFYLKHKIQPIQKPAQIFRINFANIK